MNQGFEDPFSELEETTIVALQQDMTTGKLIARQLAEMYLARIEALDQRGPMLKSVIEINPDALTIADALDAERGTQGARGPLHGIPVLIKDSIATTDAMQTTAGSLALLGSRPSREAFTVQKLREAGAIILGKTNLSEWANFRSRHSSSGWSGRGGQTRNPYVLDRTPCGSSSGSGAAIAANLAVAALGTETDGSILCPSAMCGIVGIKPTVGLISRAGVVPISYSQDTVGPMCRTVADAAAVLGAIVGVDARDVATEQSVGKYFSDYTQFLNADGLRGARIGIPREVYFGYSAKVDTLINAAIEQMRALGAVIIENAEISTAQQMASSKAEMMVLLHEFKADLNAYLADLQETSVRTLADVIAFNEAHAGQELRYFGQDILQAAEATTSLDDATYRTALEECQRLARQEGIDAVMERYQLDALVMPTVSPAWCIDLVNGDADTGGGCSQAPALAGYPTITVPAGFVFDLPVGIAFVGRAFSEPTLIKLAYAFEQATKLRRPPRYVGTVLY